MFLSIHDKKVVILPTAPDVGHVLQNNQNGDFFCFSLFVLALDRCADKDSSICVEFVDVAAVVMEIKRAIKSLEMIAESQQMGIASPFVEGVTTNELIEKFKTIAADLDLDLN
ncbi:MAG: hypothetical protein ACRC9N_11145 [Aeromonas sp.]